MADASDIDRTLGDVVRLGTIASVDRATARCTVKVGDAVSGPIPWLARANQGFRNWVVPSIGEQVVLLCPDGELAGAVAVPGIYSNHHPAPANDEAVSLHFGDGAVLRYDAQAHALSVQLPAGGTISLVAPGGVTIDADVDISGDLNVGGDLTVAGEVMADGDVSAGSISLTNHLHKGVQAGTALSGKPQ